MVQPAPTAGPTAEHLKALRRRRMVLRSDGAILIYLWGDDPRCAQWLRQRLDIALRAHSRRRLDAADLPSG